MCVKGQMEEWATEEEENYRGRKREEGRMTYEWFFSYLPSIRSKSGLWRKTSFF